ncbi:M24 family metallopeptidase [Hwanghaeella sp.]|uniref:M24 family metallopeptidase n=1 Tax=Hwanghaeella sp. TaxID=2605943 RepID=UPI003CCB8919
MIEAAEPDFPQAEYEARLDRAQRAMHADGIDALLFTTEAEMRYFTGFRTLFWLSPTRPWFLVVPKAGKPIAIIPEIGAALMRATWIEDVRCWSSPHEDDDGVSLLADALRGSTRVGIPMGRESSLRMPLNDLARIHEMLPGMEPVDATPMIQALREVKSEAEIATIAEICAIASRAFANAPKLFHEGQPLKETFRSFKIDLLREGAEDVPYLVGGADQGGYADVISPPGVKPLRAGDVLMLDTGATLRGYYCDFDRNWAFGHASDAAKRAYRTLYEATDAALAVARPGATCRDLYNAMAAVIDPEGKTGGGDVGRYGHGLGMQLTESPSNIHFDMTVMKPGMVMTLEPGMEVADGKIMVHEENLLITDGPPVLLSERAAPELPIL